MILHRYDLPFPPSSTRDMGTALMDTRRSCSSTRVSVNLTWRSPSESKVSTSWVCSTSMSMNTVFPCCRWPTSATLRTSAGLAARPRRKSVVA
ncbi:Os06g0608350 [Oryza sativa Japonica Group]|uniref:Os06g0608350 protein n=1 Tax=Oryza sativa subsp. japonica TaxID=39947 RepID=A0A0P0WYV6_ORYSJ|nr:hypothetical protein EE612_035250 [Oryza sativa]BAS98552.1 Os06g0608350 [Oryza sativa Japonica Group]